MKWPDPVPTPPPPAGNGSKYLKFWTNSYIKRATLKTTLNQGSVFSRAKVTETGRVPGGIREERFMAGLTKRDFIKGKYIVRQGTHGTSAFIIEKGKVEVFTVDAEGNKKVLAILKEKDVFGEMALIADCVRTANVRALEDCTVTVLTQEVYKNLPPDNPGVKRIRDIMASRLQALKKRSG